jgi:hypothetical protein
MVFSVRSHQQRCDSRAPLTSSNKEVETGTHQNHVDGLQITGRQPRGASIIIANGVRSLCRSDIRRFQCCIAILTALTAARRWARNQC